MRPWHTGQAMRGLLGALLLFMALPLNASAQQLGLPRHEVLTISGEILFVKSAYGRRIIDEIEAEGALLAAENERIVAELSREEQELTQRRTELEPQAFRVLAEAFDVKVQAHRENQTAKRQALEARGEEARATFVELARPILAALMRDTGASVILERSTVFLSLDTTDITAIAISRIDAAIGDGSALRRD
ncbi:OmpH family outer membrane protein [Ruegeria pomeroyi]|uniref:OmpH family outer membrane protein n=2 Tax=Ruegeria pomeroyi TaxID=89184 RepID=A0A9Q3ZQQ1_9RHOB|nr:OmpH family outer membrane protein [Ruegeria pomeroyi]MCE8528080.1 OmpH family outer membrane protein [Ruegeria pomeroyi]MCE8539474.1 OmpH family outer membrane protein [Ruegeria pomeroyi]